MACLKVGPGGEQGDEDVRAEREPVGSRMYVAIRVRMWSGRLGRYDVCLSRTEGCIALEHSGIGGGMHRGET